MILYVSDLDGTLLNNQAKVSDTSKKLLNNAIKSNVKFTIATARTPATVVNLLNGINIELPIITMNGSAIYDIKRNKYLTYTTIDNYLADEINIIIKKENLNPFIYTIDNNHLFVYHQHLKHPYQIKFFNERKDSPYKTFIESDYPSNSNILYFTIMDNNDKINLLYAKLKDFDNLYIAKYSDNYDSNIFYLEIFSIKTSKANAILYLKKYYHFNKLITFGDNINDIPMFNISDECYAVENAVTELKSVSTGIIGLNSDDSVAKYISNF